MNKKAVIATKAFDTITWMATHKPLLDMSLMLTEYLANQMISKSSKSWLSQLGWNPSVKIQDVLSEVYQYEKDLIFGRHTLPIENVIGVLNQVNSLVSGAKVKDLPLGANIAHILSTINGNASQLANLPATLSSSDSRAVLKVIQDAREKQMTTLSEDQIALLPSKSKEWVRLGLNDLFSTQSLSLDQIQAVYEKWRRWGKSHEHTVWNALIAGSLEDSKHWGNIPGLAQLSNGENQVLKFLKSALNTVKEDWTFSKRGMTDLIEKSKLAARPSQPASLS